MAADGTLLLNRSRIASLLTPGDYIGAVEGTLVFDSTGTALQDVAAAAITYERAVQAGADPASASTADRPHRPLLLIPDP